MKITKISLIALLSIVLLGACRKDEDLTPDAILLGMGGDSWAKTELDQWLYDNFTKPLNMDVKYRWDAYELAFNRTLVPIDVNRVKLIMTTVQKVWIEPYTALAGIHFLKKYAPKRYILVGSAQWNSGTITLGEAEGGAKVTLFQLNEFVPSNKADVRRRMKTVEHEFAHILHQQVLFPEEYGNITPSIYTSSWNNVTAAVAQTGGCISPYACSSPSEDFAEMVGIILTQGRAYFEAYVAGAGATGASALRAKENIIVNYFKEVWGINFYDSAAGEKGLVTLTQEAIDNL